MPANPAKSAAGPRTGRLSSASDDTLLTLARQRHAGAFDELYRRHYRETLRYARFLAHRHVREASADDLVGEAMRKVLTAIANGRGPRTGFRPYLIATLRTVAFREATKPRSSESTDTGDSALFAPGADDHLDTHLALAALATLPEQSQQILWLAEAFQLPAAETAVRLGMEPATVRVAAMRAREALRVAYLRQFLPDSSHQPCRRILNHLARRAVAQISPRQSTSVDHHLARCGSCHRAATLIDDELAHWPRRQSDADPRASALND